jgi:hypothetical protein
MVNGLLTGRGVTSPGRNFSRRRPRWTMTDSLNMPNLDGLVELATRDGVDIRPTLLRVTTDLYIQKPTHSAEEERHFTELALRLIDLVDKRTRSIVAEKIAGYPNAPAAVRQRLLREYIAQSPDAPKAFGKGKAADELSELFFAANSEERRLILLNLPYAPLKPAAPITVAAARESIHRLEAAALGHNGEVFARELERTLAISRTQARRLIDDPSGEPIAVAAVALAMPAAVLQRILLCLNPAISQSVQRVYELALLHEEIETDAALRLIAIWQASHPAEKAKPAVHQPHHWPGDRNEQERPAARPKIRWDDHAQSRKAESA